MPDDPHWKEQFPVSQPDEHRVSRREMTKFACIGAAACACAAAVRPLILPPLPDNLHPVAVAQTDDLQPGQYRLFTYPTEHHPAILIRLTDGSFAAYSQSCTHLMCPVHYDANANQLICPCHAGYFDARDGSVVAGPPPRPLPAFPVTVRGGTVFVG